MNRAFILIMVGVALILVGLGAYFFLLLNNVMFITAIALGLVFLVFLIGYKPKKEVLKPHVPALSDELLDRMNQFAYYNPGRDCTCADCGKIDTCQFSYDPYNTDGDCLAIK